MPVNNAAGNAFGSCRYDFTSQVDLIPENEQITGLIRGSLKLGQDHILTGEYLKAKNTVTSAFAAVPGSFLMPASHPHFPAGAHIIDISDDPANPIPGNIVNFRQVPAGRRSGTSEADISALAD